MVDCLYDEMFLTLFCFLGKPNGRIVQCEFPMYRGKVSCVPENSFCELYGVKF